MMGCEGIFSEILRRLERAARNDGRVHLENSHVRAILTSSVFLLLNELKQNEMSERWGEEQSQSRDGISSANTGSGTARIGMTGASAGSTTGPLAAKVSASAVALRMIHQKTRNKR
jgi:hypothetical protein